MASLVIVSGTPGSGKTTLSRAIAGSSPRGLHLESDTFYTFPVRLVEPTDPASHHQNGTIMKALGRAAGAFLEGGYAVVLDGIVGPWFLPDVRSELPPGTGISYVVLRVPETEALRRVRAREGRGRSGRVRATVAAFASLDGLESHVVDTLERTPQEIRSEVEAGLREGRFCLA